MPTTALAIAKPFLLTHFSLEIRSTQLSLARTAEAIDPSPLADCRDATAAKAFSVFKIADNSLPLIECRMGSVPFDGWLFRQPFDEFPNILSPPGRAMLGQFDWFRKAPRLNACPPTGFSQRYHFQDLRQSHEPGFWNVVHIKSLSPLFQTHAPQPQCRLRPRSLTSSDFFCGVADGPPCSTTTLIDSMSGALLSFGIGHRSGSYS
jgi:hypothetical protein